MVGWFNSSHFLLQVKVFVEPLDELLRRHVNLVVLFLLLQREGRVRDSHLLPNRTLHRRRRTLHLVIAVQNLQHFPNARSVVVLVLREPCSVFAAFRDGGAVAAAELVVAVGVDGVVVVALEVEDGFGGGEFASVEVEVEVNGVFTLGYAFSQHQEHDPYYVPELPRRHQLWAWAWAWACLNFHWSKVVSGGWTRLCCCYVLEEMKWNV